MLLQFQDLHNNAVALCARKVCAMSEYQLSDGRTATRIWVAGLRHPLLAAVPTYGELRECWANDCQQTQLAELN